MNRNHCSASIVFRPDLFSLSRILTIMGIPFLLLMAVVLVFSLLQQNSIVIQREKRILDRKREITLLKTMGMEPYVWKSAMRCVYLQQKNYPYEITSGCIPVHFKFMPRSADTAKRKGSVQFQENTALLEEKMLPHCGVCHQKESIAGNHVLWVFEEKYPSFFSAYAGWIFFFLLYSAMILFAVFYRHRRIGMRKTGLFRDSMAVFAHNDAAGRYSHFRGKAHIAYLRFFSGGTQGILDSEKSLFWLFKKLQSQKKLAKDSSLRNLLNPQGKMVVLMTQDLFGDNAEESCYAVIRLMDKLREGQWILDEAIYEEFFEKITSLIPISEAQVQKTEWKYRSRSYPVRLINLQKKDSR